jgi:hypothetical protein
MLSNARCSPLKIVAVCISDSQVRSGEVSKALFNISVVLYRNNLIEGFLETITSPPEFAA